MIVIVLQFGLPDMKTFIRTLPSKCLKDRCSCLIKKEMFYSASLRDRASGFRVTIALNINTNHRKGQSSKIEYRRENTQTSYSV